MGGRAFKGETRRVTIQEVYGTVGWLQANLTISLFGGKPFSDCLLGSAGKKETSGDIDINVDASRADIKRAAAELQHLLGPDHVWLREGNSQIFCSVPVNGDPEQGRVQVDFMFGLFTWQRFSYASPGEDSAYKGLFRTELIKALTALRSNWVYSDSSGVIARVGPTFFDSKGLVWRYRHKPHGKKDPSKRIKAFKELTEAEFLKIYPCATKASHRQMTDPDEVQRFLLGKNQLPGAFYSYETLWQSCLICLNIPQLRQLSKIYFERLESLKVPIPAPIQREHRPFQT